MTLKPLTNARLIGRAIDKSDTSIRRWADDGILPAPIQIGKNHFWEIEEICEALQKLGYSVSPTDFKEV